MFSAFILQDDSPVISYNHVYLLVKQLTVNCSMCGALRNDSAAAHRNQPVLVSLTVFKKIKFMADEILLLGLLKDGNTGNPVSGARIEAWDKDLLFDDFVGSALTDAEGRFRIVFSEEQFRELFDRRPDVYFMVYDGDVLLYDSRDTLVVILDQPKLEITLEIPASSAEQEETPNENTTPMENNDNYSGGTYSPVIKPGSETVQEGRTFILHGTNWPDCPISFKLSREHIRLSKVITGRRQGNQIRPAGDGSFQVEFAVGRSGEGKLQITALSAHRKKYKAETNLEVLANPAIYQETFNKGGKLEKSFLRQEDFFRRRFGHIGYIPEGMKNVQLGEIKKLRNRKGNDYSGTNLTHGFGINNPSPNPPSMPVPGVCNWTPLGPACVPKGQVAGSLTVSGRTLCITINPVTPSIMFIGTAGGGIWKTIDSGQSWSPVSDYAMSMAIGSIAISPNGLRLLAGTGEYHHNSVGGLTYYGNGLLRSEDGGDTWTDIIVPGFERNEISRVAFDPTDAMNNRAFLSSSNGIYESPDGNSWTLLRAGSASELAVVEDPANPGDVILIGAFYGSGLWRATRTAGVWGAWAQIIDPAIPNNVSGRIAMWQKPGNLQHITFLFNTSFGNGLRIARTTNGGGAWTNVGIRFAATITGWDTGNAGMPEHNHQLTIPVADLTSAPAAHVYTSSSAGTPAHTHTFSFSAADITKLANCGIINVWSDPDASGHTHQFAMTLSWQLDYNFVIAEHPTNANRLYIGHLGLWRTDDGLVFHPVSNGSGPTPTGIHADQHAFAFDLVNPEIVWAGNDGGLFRSAGAGDNWEARNRDLATLQYMHVSGHPQWENVLIGGTQDNGTHRYGGHPAWRFVLGGDGGFTAIDQVNPMIMYGSYIYTTFYRSDNAGANWGGISGPISAANENSEFYPPFELDPSAPNNCYFGGGKLWRSPDNGNSWAPVTGSLSANITGLAVHPGDSNTIYAGTSDGHVYRIQKTGATWAVADVTTTDITDTGMPAGQFISDIAVDTGGTVWVTFSAITWTEWTGEFGNNHVFRRVPGSMMWEGRNNGLAMANPVNTIVIDPASSNRLFIGTDLGVFRTDDAGGMWTLWDEGLPNVPIFHLHIFSPLRLLRAGTHGRGAWERPIDTVMCPLVDLYVRDNMLDSGRRNPSPEYVAHPFDPAVTVYHWQCEDIKLDSPEGAPPVLQTAAANNDYIFFESVLQHRSGKRGTTNRIYAQVHNRGVNKATNVKMRLFFADAHAGLPPLPANFWTGTMPFDGTPGGSAWVAIGDTQSFTTLEAAEPGVKSWEFTIPMAANNHSCLLLVTTCDEQPLNGGGILNVDQLVVQNKQVGLKNLNVENAVPGSPMGAAPMMGMYPQAGGNGMSGLIVDWGNLPKGTRVFFSFSKLKGRKGVFAPDAAMMKAMGVKPLKDPKEAARYFPEKREIRCGEEIEFDIEHAFEAEAEPGTSLHIPRITLSPGKSAYLQFNLVLPKNTKPGDSTFSIIQVQGKMKQGGCTYVIRVDKEKK